MNTFEELGLPSELVQAVAEMGFEEPTPIQNLAIPILLEGKDAIGQAQTGSGKTAAFGLPILTGLTPEKQVQALVLSPTRELAIQVSAELNKLAAHLPRISVLPIYGGQFIERQFRALERGVQAVVGTPGRILDHLERGTLRLDGVRTIVLDEADEMLDMGFREDIEHILEQCPEDSQRILFSATMPRPIRELAQRFLKEPEQLLIPQKMLTVPTIEQVYYLVRPYQKMEALCRLLDAQGFRKALIFCSTKKSVDEMTVTLQQRGYQADGLHGDLSQVLRDRVMNRFRSENLEILVATDVAARGIDVDNVDAVINYDIPHDVEGYVHRIGRTGRAGRDGKAFTFVTVREQYRIREIIRSTKAQITAGKLPTQRDVTTMRTSRILDEVLAALTDSPLQNWRDILEDFQNEHFPMGDIPYSDMAAAMLKLLLQRDFGNQAVSGESPELDDLNPVAPAEKTAHRKKTGSGQGERQNAGPERGRGDKPMRRIQISVGHEHKVSPGALVGAITGECGIQGKCVGAIDIHKATSLVDISAELADHVLGVLNRGVFIAGVRVTAREVARTPGQNSHKKFMGRRPFSGSGKKFVRREKTRQEE